MTPRRLAALLLGGTVLVWGASFAVVKGALADASPLIFNLLRMGIATLVLLAVNRRQLRRLTARQVAGGAVAGFFLAAGYQLQTLGLARTAAAKSAFLTGMVVVLVPLLCLVPAVRPPGGTRPGWLAIAGAGVAFFGLVLMTTPAGTPPGAYLAAISTGDLLTMFCALAYAGHLLTLARVSPGVPAGALATVQIGCAALWMGVSLPFEQTHRLVLSPRLVIALAVTSVLSTAAAFTVQSFAQQHLPASHTAAILTLEPVFAALTSSFFLGEHLGARSLAGGLLILVAIAGIELLPAVFHAPEIPA